MDWDGIRGSREGSGGFILEEISAKCLKYIRRKYSQTIQGILELAYWTAKVSIGIIPLYDRTNLFGMLFVVQTQTPDCLDIFWT